MKLYQDGVIVCKHYFRETEIYLPPRLKAATIARIHHAREILLSRLENPPSLLELTQMAGISQTTLKRGFKELFGTTVFGYLTDKPMVKAEKLLRQNNSSVAEVANLVGYSHLGHFATAFKKKVWYYTKSMFFR